MTLQRMDNVLIVVDDLEAAKAFFAESSKTRTASSATLQSCPLSPSPETPRVSLC
jgi:hypothetical protein